MKLSLISTVLVALAVTVVQIDANHDHYNDVYDDPSSDALTSETVATATESDGGDTAYTQGASIPIYDSIPSSAAILSSAYPSPSGVPPAPATAPSGCASYFQAASGDDCDTAASKSGQPLASLLSNNPGFNCDNIQIGDVFCIGTGTLPYLPVPVFKCTVPGTFAITFDDGPYLYTEGLLDYLKGKGYKTTFFVNGANYGNIYAYNATLKRMIAEGHQLAHHTWSHPDISTLDEPTLRLEISKLEDALRAILGFVPVYFRPPFGNTNLLSLKVLYSLNYKVIKWDVSAEDAIGDTRTLAEDIASFNQSLALSGINPQSDGHISLEHDPHQVSAVQFAPWAYDTVIALGYKPVTVAECLGDTNPSGWYRP